MANEQPAFDLTIASAARHPLRVVHLHLLFTFAVSWIHQPNSFAIEVVESRDNTAAVELSLRATEDNRVQNRCGAFTSSEASEALSRHFDFIGF